MGDSFDGKFAPVDGDHNIKPLDTALDPGFSPDDYQDMDRDLYPEDDIDSLGDWEDEEY